MNRYQNINFLRERVRIQEAVLTSDKQIALFTSIGLGIFMTLVIGVVAYRFYLSAQKTSLENAIEVQQQQLTALSKTQSLLAQRNMSLDTVDQVITRRGRSWEAIDYIYSILPQDATIQAINLSAVGGSLEFTVVTPNVFSYRNLSGILQSERVTQSGYNPELGMLTRAANGKYSLNVRVFIEQKAKEASPSATVETGAVAPVGEEPVL